MNTATRTRSESKLLHDGEERCLYSSEHTDT